MRTILATLILLFATAAAMATDTYVARDGTTMTIGPTAGQTILHQPRHAAVTCFWTAIGDGEVEVLCPAHASEVTEVGNVGFTYAGKFFRLK